MDSSDVLTTPESNPDEAWRLETARSKVHDEFNLPQSPLPFGVLLCSLALGAGLLAGLGSWLIGEATVDAFKPPMAQFEMMGQTLFKAQFEDQLSADAKNATLAFAVLGGTLGLALGIAGGLARKSGRAGFRAGVFGLVLGGLVGSGISLALLPIYHHALARSPEEMSHDIILPLLVHGGIWSACGLAGGVAFGIGLGAGRGRVFNAALGGLIGAALGAALYEIVGVAMFPASKTTSPISLTWNTRLLARMLVASLSGLLAAAVVNMPDRRHVKVKSSS